MASMLESILNINPERIAVTELFGAIGNPAKTTQYIRMLRAIEENKRIRALVIDIDSPGGSAGPSEYLFSSVRKVAKKKPVVAFVRGMGASGAYMVACGASKIVAVPMALVGSIGVISMRPMLYEALDRLGVLGGEVKAKNTNALSIFSERFLVTRFIFRDQRFRLFILIRPFGCRIQHLERFQVLFHRDGFLRGAF